MLTVLEMHYLEQIEAAYIDGNMLYMLVQWYDLERQFGYYWQITTPDGISISRPVELGGYQPE